MSGVKRTLTFTAAMMAAALMASGSAVAAPDAAAGKAAFAQCSVCHSVVKGGAGIGPNLVGVYGRKMGALPGFAYSSAMKAKGGVWNDAALDAFLANPQKAIPGDRMPYPGQPDAGKRAALIAYLKTLQ